VMYLLSACFLFMLVQVDHLHELAHIALEGTRLGEADLNRRFSQLNISLASRIQPLAPSVNSPSTALSSYLSKTSVRPSSTTDPQALLRAMSRADAERPQAQVGDAARRAAREAQRAHDASNGMSERRLTGVPPPTPRKPPGTPRRATTPGRGR
jgi:kinetochore protein Mis13/DSN1